MTIQELIENRKKLWEGAKAFVESKRDKDGLLSDEDIKIYNEMESKIKALGDEINRMKDRELLENELKKATSTPLTQKPGMNDELKTGRASDAYKKAMFNALRTNFRQVSNILQEGIDSSGGYLVPEEYDTRLIQGLTDENILRKLGTII